MFICDLCSTQVAANVAARRVVIAITTIQHPRREYYLRGDYNPREDRGGPGTQISREATSCPECAAIHTGPLTRGRL
jgi:hypothetical protein